MLLRGVNVVVCGRVDVMVVIVGYWGCLCGVMVFSSFCCISC
jgi:hypothetical protein